MEKSIKNILVPINFSSSSSQAIETGIAMSKRHGAILHLLKVDSESKLPYPTGKNALLVDMRLRARVAEEVSMEHTAKQISEQHEITCFYHISEGSFAQTVASVAQDFYCDLIVLEKRPHSLFGGLVSANSAYDIIEAAACPVLTIPNQKRNDHFDSILFSVWPTSTVFSKLDALMPIIRKDPAMVTLFGSTLSSHNLDEYKLVGRLNNTLKSTIRTTNSPVATESDATPRTAKKIIRKALEKKADLVVISASIRKGFKDFFLPNYTEQMINRCPVAVLSVK